MAPQFKIIQETAVSVIELALPEHFDSAMFDDLNTSLLGLFHENGQRFWVIDFANVSYIGSAVLGMLVNIRQRVRNINGRLVLCNLSPRLTEMFRTSALERLFTIARSRREATILAQ